MRIRKRQPPLPLSSLSPVPLPDPHSNRCPVVQLHNHPPQPHTAPHFHPQPSDQPNPPIGTATNSFDCSDVHHKEDCLVLMQKEHEKGVEEEKSNDSREKNMLGAEIVVAGVVFGSSSSHQAVGRWCEGEKAFPLKKRRGNFERKANEETIVEKDDNTNPNNKKMKTKMKTKMNKKFGSKDDNDNEQEEGERKESGDQNSSTGSGKKRGRGGALMEGSRCSRVNGRGWRCCQQTLVGYSLCEHHLGKGRLRSMTSVRSRALGSSAPINNVNNNTDSTSHPPLSTTSLSIHESDQPKREAGEEDDEKPLVITAAAKKRMKLGMVKARSISSLLGQPNNEITVSDK